MPYQWVKHKLLDLYRHNVEPRLEALHAETIYQGLFDQQCRRLHLDEPFYPVGAAASYSLMYLLARVMTELAPRRIVELGSGQTTVLIDRLRTAEGSHVAYEQSELWARTMRERAPGCDLRLRPVGAKRDGTVAFQGYDDVQALDFDLLLVDGPNGTDRHSRYDCVPLVAANRSSEFIVIVDDAGRTGEAQTVAALSALLKQRGIDHKLNHLAGRTTQAVITTPAFRAASYFY
jgi:hypothetical protein